MRPMTVLFGFLFLSFSARAQTEITKTSFVESGDILKTITSFQGGSDFVTPGGENQAWDFSGLAGGTQSDIEYASPTTAANKDLFPSATCVQFLAQGLGEEFYESTDDHFASLGVGGANTFGLNFISNTIYDQPYILRRAMTYDPNDVLQTSAVATIRISLDDLPAGLGDTLRGLSPIPFDSIGFGLRLNRRDEIDGWGTLTIPGGTYDVLRETRREERNSIVEVKLPFIGWQDVSGLIGGVTGGTGNFINDTTFTHVYLSNEAKEPIAVVTLSADGQSAVSTEYKNNGASSAEIIIDDIVVTMAVSPNPTNGPIQVQIENLPKGIYKLDVHDLSGRILKNQSFSSAKNITLTQSINNLTSGVYFISLKTNAGELLATEKLVVD